MWCGAVPPQLHSCSPTVRSSHRHRGAPLAHGALCWLQSFILDGQAGGNPVSGARRRNVVSSSRNLCRVLGLSTGTPTLPYRTSSFTSDRTTLYDRPVPDDVFDLPADQTVNRVAAGIKPGPRPRSPTWSAWPSRTASA